MWRILFVSIGIFRILVPIFIFSSPLLATATSIFLDAIDCTLARLAGLKWKTYHIYDKLLDYWWYVFILLYSTKLTIFPIIAILFLIRSIGQVASLLTFNTSYLVFFPNVLENFFVFYLLSLIWPSLGNLFVGYTLAVPLLIAILAALLREYLAHVKHWYPSELIFGVKAMWKNNGKG